ncbi:MAG TPA: peptidylprolyl isomerase [Planctomycetota bacterium]|nr:peptidylprolyl isomerase [Planctomycetota bacterium]
MSILNQELPVLHLLLAFSLFQAPATDAARKARADLDTVRKSIEQMMTLREKDQKLREQLQAGSDDEERLKKLSKMREELGKEFQELRGSTVKAMDGVIASTSEALKGTPDDTGLLEVRGEAYLIYQKNDLALPDLERLLKLKPDDGGELTLKVARLEHAVNRYEAAADNFDRVLKKDVKNLEARLMLAICDFSIHRFEESVKILEELLKGDITPDMRSKAAQFLEMAQKYLPLWKTEQEIRARQAKADDLPQVRFTTTKGDIEIELFENEAPNTVSNFIELVSSKYYDGLKFHRVIPGFMAQGGDPTGSGAGGPGYRFKDEITPESRLHFRGTLSMANAGPNTNGSQFFLTHLPTDWLNGKHTVFGRVVAGQAVVDSLIIGDSITKAEVVRKRDHEYKVVKIEDPKPTDK